MAAKRKQLPIACICGKTEGTVRIVYPYIQHRYYSAEAYKKNMFRKPEKEYAANDPLHQQDPIIHKPKKREYPHGMVSHSFRSEWTSYDVLDFDLIKKHGWRVKERDDRHYRRHRNTNLSGMN